VSGPSDQERVSFSDNEVCCERRQTLSLQALPDIDGQKMILVANVHERGEGAGVHEHAP
jgi:hypothetical protein